MNEPQKRTVLTRFWIGETVYHIADSGKGTVLHVQITTDRCVPRYYVVFNEHQGEWCEEMELTNEAFTPAPSP